ncbi:MAG: MFS transporter, partial [Bryobacterales bacterium]|nr:MFS transporter [Bryobacterales bacterium]
LGLTVVGMSRASTGFWTLAAFVTLTRGLGQSALSVVSLAHVGKWFARRLPMAMGIYALLVSVGFIAAFPSVGAAVLAYGWRASWQGVGLALLAGFLPAVWLFASNADATAGEAEDLGAQPGDLTFAAALATPSFWVFGLASAAFGLVYSGIALFNESILAQRGFPPAVYHQTLVVSTMIGLVANFAGGWLAPRWSVQRLMAVGMAALALSLAALPLVATVTHTMLWAASMGIAGGIVTVVFFSVWSQVFGRAHLGRIQGAAQMLTVLASATGPVLLASTLARDGAYDAVFRALAVFVVLLAVACWVVPLPRRTAPAALQGAMAQ